MYTWEEEGVGGPLGFFPMSACRGSFWQNNTNLAKNDSFSTLPDKMKSRARLVLSCEQISPFLTQMAKIRKMNAF